MYLDVVSTVQRNTWIIITVLYRSRGASATIARQPEVLVLLDRYVRDRLVERAMRVERVLAQARRRTQLRGQRSVQKENV